jgi:hypothetical protein
MIHTHSVDPDVEQAAQQALHLIRDALAALPPAERFDYGGHVLELQEYELCARCTGPIAEAQLAHQALVSLASSVDDPDVKAHIELAAHLFELEAAAAIVRAEFHNGHGTEKILNYLLGYQHDRTIHDSFDHSHHKGA